MRSLSLVFLLLLSLLGSNLAHAAPLPPHVQTMLSWEGEREARPNRSPLIDKMNRFVGSPLGSPYCAAAVSLALETARVRSPTIRTGLAQNFRTTGSIRAGEVLSGRKVVPVGAIAIWQIGRSWKGHAALVVAVIDRQTIRTIEANTSCAGNGDERDGDGICRKLRKIEPYNYFGLRWFTPVTY